MSKASIRSTASEGRRRYALGEQLGAGGMGVIYRAQDRLVGREVAYKRMRVDREAQRTRTTALFRREYETLIGLQHPNTVEVYDYGLDEEGPYYTMELLSGDDLAHAAPLPWREACSILRDIASALALVHARRLVHRDVSPNNVRLTREGPAKLFDFGALAHFGPQTEIIGTPQFIAPECVRGEQIDQRADLFSFGALAYWALTRSCCFNVDTLEGLEAVWARPLVPMSRFDDSIPGALDELIRTLLQLDHRSRPSSAAYVIERLTSIAQLPPEAAPREIALRYLRRPPLAEREQALATLDRALRDVMNQRGSMVLVEADAGLGRSALLERFTLEARLVGATVLRGEGAGRGRSYDLCRRLVESGLQTYPDPDNSLQEEVTSRILLPDHPEAAQSAMEAIERRSKRGAWLRGKLLEFSLRGPLILVVDDAQNVDADSLSMLASMVDEARRYPVMMVISMRRDDGAIDPQVRTALGRASAKIALDPISEAGLSGLVRTIFGAVPNTKLTSAFVQRESGGNPARAMDLLRLLIQNSQIRYESGTFILPPKVEIDAVALSDRALLARAADMDESAQAVMELVALATSALTLAQLTMATALSERDVLLALERLEQRGIVHRADDSCHMGSDLLRGAVVRSMSDTSMHRHHEALARALLTSSDNSLETRTSAGLHLLRSGPKNELAGAQLILDASRDHTFEAVSFASVTSRLKEAHAVMKAHGKSDLECIDLLVPLSFLGFYGDLDAQRTYLDPTLHAFAQRTGLTLVAPLRKLLGARLSLYLALAFAVLAGMLTRRYAGRALGYELNRLFLVVGAAAAAAASACEGKEAHRIANSLSIFSVLPPDTSGAMGYDFALASAELASAKRVSAAARYERLFKIMSSPVKIKGMDERRREQARLGCLHGLAQLAVQRGDPVALELADELERASAFFAPLAETVRVGFYASRGDDARLEQHRTRAEALAMRGGVAWSVLTLLTLRCMYGYMLVGNVIGMVRVIVDLERLLSVSESLRAYHALARAHLDTLRGQYDSAIAIYEQVLGSELGQQLTTYRRDCGYYATALSGRGDHQQARALCQSVLSPTAAQGQDRDDRDLYWISQRLALAESGLGNYDAAVHILDRLLAASAASDNPLVGLTFRDRALVAIAMHDAEGYARFAQEAESRLRSSQNPWLIGQYEALVTHAMQVGLIERRSHAMATDSLDTLNSTFIEDVKPLEDDKKAV